MLYSVDEEVVSAYMENIILVGFMGTGKTTVGIELSKILDMDFLDTDKLIEKREGMKISDIFKSKGEKYFRKLEFEIVSKILKGKSRIISTGGGAVQNPSLYSMMKKNGTVVALTANIDTLWKRLKDKKDRPLLAVENPKEVLTELYKKREPLYREAHLVIETDNRTPGEIAREIADKYKMAHLY